MSIQDEWGLRIVQSFTNFQQIATYCHWMSSVLLWRLKQFDPQTCGTLKWLCNKRFSCREAKMFSSLTVFTWMITKANCVLMGGLPRNFAAEGSSFHLGMKHIQRTRCWLESWRFSFLNSLIGLLRAAIDLFQWDAPSDDVDDGRTNSQVDFRSYWVLIHQFDGNLS